MKPLYSVRKHSIVFEPHTLPVLRAYINYVKRHLKAKLDDMEAEHQRPAEQTAQAITESHRALLDKVRQELARAEEVDHDLELLGDEFVQIYLWHYTQLATVFRAVRCEAGVENILTVPELKLAIETLMRMLKSENPRFNPDMFINEINGGSR